MSDSQVLDTQVVMDSNKPQKAVCSTIVRTGHIEPMFMDDEDPRQIWLEPLDPEEELKEPERWDGMS